VGRNTATRSLKSSRREIRRGNPPEGLANYVLAAAADGYKVVFAIPELDPVFTDLVFLLAYRRDGQAVDAKERQFRIVAPNEKRNARWIRQLVAISIRRAE